MDSLVVTLQSGLASLAAYLAAHVLLCLVPAFFIAGGLSALLPKSSITRYLGRCAEGHRLSGGRRGGQPAGRVLLHHRPAVRRHLQEGRRAGASHHLLFFAPAANILASDLYGRGARWRVRTGAVRAVAGVRRRHRHDHGVLFHRDDAAPSAQAVAFEDSGGISRTTVLFLAALVALLIGGTLKVASCSTATQL